MKKTVLKSGVISLALMLAASASATVLTVKHGSDQTTQVDITKISRIHFENGQMVITHTDGTHQIDLGDIQHMRFDLTATSIADINTTIDDINVIIAHGFITVNSAEGTPIKLNVYNLSGFNVAASDGVGSVGLDLGTLPAGIYIVKANNKTIKFIR